ncbi:uncharacterized protein [Panulirus ornatus]|uniref:uncharacterized protein n=1 Tax=Panulirus ornatus TaxID=150431 RepID=UPI003A8A968D
MAKPPPLRPLCSMGPLVLVTLLAAATSAAPQGYPPVARPYGQSCRDGRVLHIDGTCVYPTVHRFLYLYAPPEQPQVYGPPPEIPKPKEHHNLVFIKTPEQPKVPDPIVVPPPKQENIVYVLNKQSPQTGQRVIEVPSAPPTAPEVYFINYDDETQTLPGGIDIQTALNSAVQIPSPGAGGAGGALGGGVSNGGGGVAVQDGAYGPPPNAINTPPSLYPLP